ncbi:MAG TPA: hypothetical protein VIH57_23435 [Bacteroidales bacterium]
MDTTITTSERELLLMLLQKEENTLQIEINHTAHREFKLILKERLQMITALIEKLKVGEPTVAF